MPNERACKLRLIWIAVIFAGIGLGAAVASAWGVQFMRARNRVLARVQGDVQEWGRAVPATWGRPYIRVDSDEFWSHAVFYAGPRKEERMGGVTAVDAELEEVRFGVPFRCVAYWTLSERSIVVRGGKEMHGMWGITRGLSVPVQPLWWGLGLDVASYGLLAWGVWRVPRMVRRCGWRRKGMCVRCGYDLKGLGMGAVCPECGAARRV